MPGADRGAKVATPPESVESDVGSLNLQWAERFVAALGAAGVREAVIAPGSRSAPLAVALHRSPIRTHVALDERAGAFFALGLAKASGRPAAVLCTSGTAAANFHPAILEAHHGRVPLIALTADRPPELRGIGAPQTTDQIKLYGGAVRWFCEVGTPASGAEAARYVAGLGRRAVSAAWGPHAGPVHLNFPFREPLLPRPAERDATAAGAARENDAADPGPSLPSLDELRPDGSAPSRKAIDRLARRLLGGRRGIIACGPDDARPDFDRALRELAARTGYPVLADPLSGLRYGTGERTGILGAYDVFLRSARFAAEAEPDVILHFGAPLTSKAFDRYAARFPAALHVGVDVTGAFRDPGRRTSTVIAGDPALAAAALASALGAGKPAPEGWLDLFRNAEDTVRAVLARRLSGGDEPVTEAGLFPALLEAMGEARGEALAPDPILFAGNSMPVRDLDSFAPGSDVPVRVLGNRGLNGIDGVLSTALGASAASDAPLLVVIGDLSFHHDLNGLAALREGRARATIVVVNNDGGGIFSFLPSAEHRDVFERYFGTPHGMEFESAATLYGLPYSRPASRHELIERAAGSLRSRRSEIIEVRTDRAANVEQHRELLAEAVRAVEEGL